MGRSPCHDQDKGVKKGPWMPEEDEKLTVYINKNGHVKWRSLPKLAGLNRCGKSCRLRWMNYLRPDIRRGEFSDEEESTIVKLHALLGNKWSKIASQLPGRTDNEIKNYWNTHMRKKLLQMGIDPMTHEARTNDLSSILGVSQLLATAINNGQFGNSNFFNNNNNTALEDLLKLQLIQKMLQIITPKAIPNINNVNTTSLNSKPESAAGQLDAIGQQVFINQSANIWDGLEDNQLPSLVTFSREKLNTAKPDASTTTDQTRVGMMAGYEISSSDSVWVCPEISSMNHPGTTQQSSGSEDWEKFLDDGSSDSCWKSFLDLTSPTSSTVPW